VERLRALYVPWSPADACFIDAMQPFDHNLAQVLAYLQK
jgi:hypothetical protein